MFCLHRRYQLGDVGGRPNKLNGKTEWCELNRMTEPSEFEAWWRRTTKGTYAIRLPLFLYDHSGITISTAPFSCPWDSGQVGFIFITADKIRREYMKKRISPEVRNRARMALEQEVKTYDAFLRNEFVGITVKLGDEEEAVGGFDDRDYAIKEAKEIIDCWTKKEKVA
jgi:hypothetical protein